MGATYLKETFGERIAFWGGGVDTQHVLSFGTPEEVIQKLRRYERLGIDQFTYCASYGLGLPEQKRSLELFIKEVMPAFDSTSIDVQATGS